MEAVTDLQDLENFLRNELVDCPCKTTQLPSDLKGLIAQLGWDDYKVGCVRRSERKRAALVATMGDIDQRRNKVEQCQARLDQEAPELLRTIQEAEQAQAKLDELQGAREMAVRELDEATDAKALLMRSSEFLSDHDLDRLRSVRDEYSDSSQEFSETKSHIAFCERAEKLTADDLLNHNLRDGYSRVLDVRITETTGVEEVKHLASERLIELRERYKALKEIVDQRDNETKEVMASNLR